MEKSNLMMIVIIVLLVALLGTVVGVTFYAFNMVQRMEAAAHQAELGWEREARVMHPDEINRIEVGDAIVTNLVSETGGTRGTARIQVVVGYDNTMERESVEISEMLNEHIAYVRTVSLEAIQNSTYNELTARGAMAALAEEILYRLQNDFRSNMIVEVSFIEWIIMP